MNFSLLSVPLRTPDNWVILRASEKQWVKIIFSKFWEENVECWFLKNHDNMVECLRFSWCVGNLQKFTKAKKNWTVKWVMRVSWRWMMCFADTFKVTYLWSFSSKWIKDWINKAQEIVLLFTLYITLFK